MARPLPCEATLPLGAFFPPGIVASGEVVSALGVTEGTSAVGRASAVGAVVGTAVTTGEAVGAVVGATVGAVVGAVVGATVG